MTTAVTTEAAPSRHRWLCFFLAVIATIELVDALTSIQTIFTDHASETTALRLAQTLTNIRLLLTPLIVAAALVFARWAMFTAPSSPWLRSISWCGCWTACRRSRSTA